MKNCYQQFCLAIAPVCCSMNTSSQKYNSVTTILGATNYFPIYLLPTTQKGTHKWHCKPEQNSRTREVIGPSAKTTAVALLSKCDVPVKVSFKHLCLRLWTTVPVGLKWSWEETSVSNRKYTSDSQPHGAFEDKRLLLGWRQVIRPLDHLSQASGITAEDKTQGMGNLGEGVGGGGV